jgi:hypothetical protein
MLEQILDKYDQFTWLEYPQELPNDRVK